MLHRLVEPASAITDTEKDGATATVYLYILYQDVLDVSSVHGSQCDTGTAVIAVTKRLGSIRKATQHQLASDDVTVIALSICTQFKSIAGGVEGRVFYQYVFARFGTGTFQTHGIIVRTEKTVSYNDILTPVRVKCVIVVIGMVKHGNAIEY